MTEPGFNPTYTEAIGSNCQYRYNELTDCITKGSFGVLYKARIIKSGHFVDNEIVVVKRIRLHQNANSESWNMTRLRWKKMFSLKHNHLLAYYKATVVKAPGGIFVEFVMDYYSEGDLALLLSYKLGGHKQPFDQEAVICWALQLAGGLAFLHQNGIIHGDIKPGNVLVKSADGSHHKLVIGDWDDYVQIQPDHTSALEIILFHGTVRYMSPEMLKSKCSIEVTNENIGCKTDVWSLGCVILELANCSIGNTEKCLHRETKVQTVETLTDFRFAGLINEGWVPFVTESIPISVAACIHECLLADHTCRISADKLLEKLRDTATELQAPGSSNVAEPGRQECFCS